MLARALDLPAVKDRLALLGEEVPAPERRSPEYFKQVRGGRDRALERPDQGKRRHGGVNAAIVAVA